MKKYLFLDIDGVLNHESWYSKIRQYPDLCPGPFPYECFDPDCVKRVNEILKATSAELVISSSWRFDNELMNTFAKVGLPEKFLVTPIFDIYSSHTDFCRGDEIKAFLDKHPYDRYAIVDDDDDMLDEQLPYFVQTKGECGDGLNEEVKEKLINILNNGI